MLWRAKEDEVVGYFDQLWLELFFGSVVFTPKRTSSRPGNDKVLNWARLGLYMAPKEPHVLSEEEAEERRLAHNENQRLYDAKPVNKAKKRLYNAKSETKAKRQKADAERNQPALDQQRHQREGCVEAMRMLANEILRFP